MRIGNENIKDIYYNFTFIIKVYQGEVLLYSRESEEPSVGAQYFITEDGLNLITEDNQRLILEESEVLNSVLPEGYTELEYIQANGQNINTEYQPTKNTTIEIGYEFTSIPANNYYYVFGNYSASGRNSTRLMTSRTNGDTIINMFTKTDFNNFKLDGAKQVGVRYDDIVSNDTYTTNGTIYTISDDTEGTSNTRNLALCANYVGGRKSHMKLYYCKIREGDTLIRDYIPCLDADGTQCFYDKVTEQSYYLT